MIHTAQIWATAMGGGMSSRLFQEIRENRGLCYTIFAQAGAYEDTGLTTIYAGTSADDIVELVDLTVAEMRRAADDMTDAEVARARAQMKAGMLMGLESPVEPGRAAGADAVDLGPRAGRRGADRPDRGGHHPRRARLRGADGRAAPARRSRSTARPRRRRRWRRCGRGWRPDAALTGARAA